MRDLRRTHTALTTDSAFVAGTAITAIFAVFVILVTISPTRADVIDPDSAPVPILSELVAPLAAAGIDVVYSHASEAAKGGPSFGDRPRAAPLHGFDAWPGVTVDLERYGEWLEGFASGARGAVAAVASDEPAAIVSWDTFKKLWKGAAERERVFITFDGKDRAAAEQVAAALEANGYAVYLAIAEPEHELVDAYALGRMFGEADHHIVVDTASARMNPVIRFEAELLAELRRQALWVASDDAGLPPVKRGSMDVVETLGMLPMKILPGGIVLGVKPMLAPDLAGATLAISGSDYGIEVDGQRYVLEQVSRSTREAIRAFVANVESHSVVDIAGGDVTLAAPFQETNIGERMIHADRRPFELLSIRGAKKSLIVDEGVRIRRREDDRVVVDVTLGVRFYRRDDGGHADRLADLRFTVESVFGSARLLDLNWSRRPDSRIGFDGAAAGELVDQLEQLALDAALIALARLTPE